MTKHQNRRHCLLGTPVAGALLLLMTAGSALCLTWSPEELVGGDDDYDDIRPSVTATPDGLVWAVWTGTDPAQGDKEVYYSVRAGSGWTQRERVHPNNGVEDGVPEIDSGADAVPWVVWTRKHEGAYDLVVSHWDGAAWAPYEVIRDGGDRYDTYALEVASSSDIWVVTDAFVEGHDARWLLAYHWDGAAWSEPWLVGHPGTDRAPAIRVAPDGRPWLVWIAFGLSGEPVNAVAYSTFEGGAWTAPAVIDGEPGNGGLGPEILFDVDGTPIVAWEGNGHLSGGYDIVYSRLLDGAWTAAGLVSVPRTSWYQTNGGLHSDQDSNGAMWLFWVSADGDDFHASDVRVCPWLGSRWGCEESPCDTTYGKHDSSGDIAVAPDGSLWATWMAYVDVAPYDYFTLASHGTCVTAVDFCCLEAERSDEAVVLTWYASGSAASGPFRVWREASPDTGDLPAQPTAEATQLSGTWEALGTAQGWTDSAAESQTAYAYWVEWTSPGGSAHLGPAVVPSRATWIGPARLLGVLPNPSRDGCTIAYELAQAGEIVVEIYDVSGRAVRRLSAGERGPGRYDVGSGLAWDGRSGSGARAAAGTYFVRLLFSGRRLDGQLGAVTLVR
jgi:hypothetical protein